MGRTYKEKREVEPMPRKKFKKERKTFKNLHDSSCEEERYKYEGLLKNRPIY